MTETKGDWTQFLTENSLLSFPHMRDVTAARTERERERESERDREMRGREEESGRVGQRRGHWLQLEDSFNAYLQLIDTNAAAVAAVLT